MATYKYGFQDYNKETMSRGVFLSLSVSTKHCIEIANHIKGKNVETAIKILDEAIALKKAIPFKRFNHNVGHKTDIGPGRFPVKACAEMKKLVESCIANAQSKGFNTSNLKILHISVNYASRPWHHGRARRRQMKRTNVEMVLIEEAKDDKKDKKNSKKRKTEDKKELSNNTDKKEEKKETLKTETKEIKKAETKSIEPKKEEIKAVVKEEEKKIVENKKETKDIVTDDKKVEKEIKKETQTGVNKDEPKKDTVAKN